MSLIPIVEGKARRGAYLPIVFVVAIALMSTLPRIAPHESLKWTYIGIASALALWTGAIYLLRRKDDQALHFSARLAAPHYVQACLHGTIYIFWGFYWELVGHNAMHLVGQILFAYTFEGLLAWSRGKAWRLGFGPFPIVFSTNLFLTFKDEWFVYQFLLIAVVFLAKELIVWQRDGVKTHIFNPSAFALFLFAIVLISTEQTDKTWVSQLSAMLDTRLVDPDSKPYLLVFAVGLVAQFLFQVTLVTFAAAMMLFVLPSIYTALTGTFWFVDVGIPIAVFLGLHLLITDPATSPKNNWGRFLFGTTYGLSVFVIYGVLDFYGEPLAYDKLLFVPVLNLLVIRFEQLGTFLETSFAKLREHVRLPSYAPNWNLVHMALWIGLFALMYSVEYIESDHPGRHLEHWQTSCADDRPNACRNLTETLRSRCTQGAVRQCAELSRLYEEKPELATPLERQIWFGDACDVGATRECDLYRQNLTAKMNAELEASCDAGDSPMSCYVLGSGYVKGINRGSRRPDKAYPYILEACEQGLGKSCAVAGMMNQFGFTQTRDLERAVALHERACALSFTPSCASLVDIYSSDDSPLADDELSRWYRAKACAIGATPLCED